jgi:hypothetical protein
MSSSSINAPLDRQEKQPFLTSNSASRSCFAKHSARFWIILSSILIVIILGIGLGVGLGIGLNESSGSNPSSPSSTPSSSPTLPTSNNTNATSGTFWAPQAGATWQIVLEYPLNDTSYPASVYDIDMFDNPVSTIQNLHSVNRSVICYFSAGSYENWRPDADNFTAADYGKELDGWPGEYWLNTSSPNVRNIMTARLQIAKDKGCDGVDPDNVDGYANDNGVGLTAETAIDYLTFLAISAHGLGMSLGLKNAVGILNATLPMMQWSVNEQCTQYNECQTFAPFIELNKPVFHIEYPDGAPEVNAAVFNGICGDEAAKGFSTVLKEMELSDWIEAC